MRMIPNRLKSHIFDIAAESHIGLVRKTNQDRYFLREFPDGEALTAIADGLGGIPAGDMAADLIVETLSQVEALEPGTEECQLTSLAIELDRMVAEAQQSNPRLGGMGSTLILVWMKNGRAFWAHVGDSRLYLLRSRRLCQITRDQTLARFLVAEGEITPEQARSHYAREVMNQCLGCGFCEPETGSFKLTPGDVLLLSTDGLHRSMTTARLEALLNARTGVSGVARTLVEAALAAGGRDNITGVITRIERPGRRAMQKGGSHR